MIYLHPQPAPGSESLTVPGSRCLGPGPRSGAMFHEAWSYLLYLYTVVHQAVVPCARQQELLVKTIDHQQYLGKWYFKAAVSHREADIQMFKAFDNIVFTIEEKNNDTLLLTGNMRMGDDCITQKWTYRLQPGRDDMVLEGRPQRRNLLWSGAWADCSDCIVFQEVEPPLRDTDAEDSLSRQMLYARRSDTDSEMVTTFLKSSACYGSTASVTLPQEKAFCL
ncbi:apolipoprotein M [Cololabis saira]|uniref:apolipoprotein M n=1 Tax=Cololabis saira TaxID=129043 RepID=UPI002AD56236|nr:apolipoprotein M [Cololabis saira]